MSLPRINGLSSLNRFSSAGKRRETVVAVSSAKRIERYHFGERVADIGSLYFKQTLN